MRDPVEKETSASAGSCDEELLLAYLQGRLPDHERAQVELLIDKHPDYRRLAAALVELSVAESGNRRTLADRKTGEVSGTRSGPEHSESVDFAPGTLVGGKYKIGGEIGMGAMGLVLEADHLHLGEKRAIKVLRNKEQNAESVARFVREARAAMAVDSEHVARVYDLGALEDGRLYLVMELLTGENLRAYAQREGPLVARDAAKLMLQATHGVSAAHRRGVIHRDLKPANLFIVHDAEGENAGQPLRVKILDFGLAKTQPKPDSESQEQSLTTESSILGSPMYMSPEQIRDARRVDARSDIWSLGVIFHELLAGSAPFRATTVGGLLASIVADKATSLPASTPPALVEIIDHCLQKEPEKRIGSADELARRLEAFLRGDTALAASNGTSKRWLLLAAAVLALALAITAWWTTRTPPVQHLRTIAGQIDAERSTRQAVSPQPSAADPPQPSSALTAQSATAPEPVKVALPRQPQPIQSPAAKPSAAPVDPLLGPETETRK